MNIRATVFILVMLVNVTFAQVDKGVIKEQAEQTANALLKADYETLIKYTYPKVVELVGGKEKMIETVKKGQAEMRQQGITFESVKIGEPSKTVVAGDEIHCLVPQTLIMKVPKGRLKTNSPLLGVSKDNGKHWYFIDTAGLSMDNVKTVLANYNPELKLPVKKEPEFIPD